jgi:O-antigen chain-terminating methyltransferase
MQHLRDDTVRISTENEKFGADLHLAHQRIAELSQATMAITEQVNSNSRSVQAIKQDTQSLQQTIEDLARLRSHESKKLAEQVAVIDRYAIQTRRDVTLQQRRLTSILNNVRKHSQATEPHAAENGAKTELTADIMADLYLALEDAFRGSRQDIAERVSEYLPILDQAGLKPGIDLIVDIGCGRGEWLDVLSKNGYLNKGCDSNESMVATCKELGLDVTQSDALRFLGSLPDNSVAAVTAFHVFEHLPLSAMLALIDESLRVIRPGGIVVFETPNPHNVLVSSHNFYLDPTHQKPIPMILLQFIVEERGFCEVRSLPLHPYPESVQVANSSEIAQRFNELFYGPQDYAIIGKKL